MTRLKLPLPAIALCAAVAIASFGASPADATAFISSHTGTVGSTPPGTGQVDVALECTVDDDTEICTKTFRSLEPHELVWSSSGFLDETVVNATGMGWTDFHQTYLGFDNVMGAVTLSCAAGEGFDCGSGQTLLDGGVFHVWLFFLEPFFPGNGTDSLHLLVQIEGSGTILQHPSIPEPATLALFGLGLAGLGLARRRKSAA